MRQTCLTEWHREQGAKLVDFAGWEMPIQYSTIVAEHQAVRTQAGLFDISHMGRFAIRGERAGEFLNYVTTIDVQAIKPGRIRYALATNAHGGIRDDILVYRVANEFLTVVNASNREKLLEFWGELLLQFPGVRLIDQTFDTGMIALQGPASSQILRPLQPEISELKYYSSLESEIMGVSCLLSRTGYTGEDGFEIICPATEAVSIWEKIRQSSPDTVSLCGLGCRDTLRLEAGMPLYGHELSEEINPISAGLQFALNLQKASFLGREPLLKIAETGPDKYRVGLEFSGRKIAREGAEIISGAGDVVGVVTSGTFSPTLQKPIAMGYVPGIMNKIGTTLTVLVRGTDCPACVTELPFYQRS